MSPFPPPWLEGRDTFFTYAYKPSNSDGCNVLPSWHTAHVAPVSSAMASISAIHAGCALGSATADPPPAAAEARVRGCWDDDEEGAVSKEENMEANIDLLLSDDSSASMLFALANAAEEAAAAPPASTAAPASLPKALIPTSARFRRSSASSFFRSRVFRRNAPILSEVATLSSFSASSSVSARMPLGFLMLEAVLSDVISIQ
mmetsp:Transcript_3512/g.7858  ORF Transcript_3512/g.7858 Transcript_3512/m.7858 type:complete len:203 (+) Transcript_3512:1482-2090(+)